RVLAGRRRLWRRRRLGSRECRLRYDCNDHDDGDERTARLLAVHALPRRAELPRPAALRRWEREADDPPTPTEPRVPGRLHSVAPDERRQRADVSSDPQAARG